MRRLVTDLGYGVEEMAHNRERSICCGSGGMVPAVAPELAKKMTDFRLSEATRDLVTYCASCRARLSKAGHPTLHVLDLPFNPAWQQTKTQPPPHNLKRWWRRRVLGSGERAQENMWNRCLWLVYKKHGAQCAPYIAANLEPRRDACATWLFTEN